MPEDFQSFQSQSYRLLRRIWPNPTALAQELYSIMAPTSGGFPESEARTPQNVLQRRQKALDELTPHQAIGLEPGLPGGFTPPAPKPLGLTQMTGD